MRNTAGKTRAQEKSVSVRRRRRAWIVVCAVCAGILLGTSLNAFARSSAEEPSLYKYYTAIEVQAGDTLWDIAQEYTKGTEVSVREYMDEVCALNHISEDEIHAGGHLVISYYSAEIK